MPPILEDGADTQPDGGLDTAADAILRRWSQEDDGAAGDNREPPDETGEETTEKAQADSDEDEDPSEEDSDDESGESPDEDEEDAKEEEKPTIKKYVEDDNTLVKIKVDGEEREVAVKDLTRLFGQEASLTRKSQEVATLRKQNEENGAKYTAALAALYERAQKEFEPYSKLNFLALTKELETEELTALQAEAKARYDNVQFLGAELDAFMGHVQTEQKKQHQGQAQECLKVLMDPDKGIKGWNDQLYTELMDYGMASGLPKDMVYELVDPTAFKLLHKAMLFDKGQKVQEKTQKVVKSPKKILKTSDAPRSARPDKTTEDSKRALQRLSKSGSIDDAANAFLARWGQDD